MQHRFRDSRPHGPLDRQRLAAFEEKIGGGPLPEPYRSFLLEHNGCTFGSKKMPTTFFGLHDQEHASLDGPTYPNPEFLPPELLTIGLHYGDTPWLIGVTGEHRGKLFHGSCADSDWASASQGEDVWTNVVRVADDFPTLLDLIAAEAALEDGDEKRFVAEWLDRGHDPNEPILGRLPLEIVLAENRMKLARALAARGAKATNVDDTMFRSIGPDGDIRAFLFVADALDDVNRVITSEGWTMLDLAVWQDHYEAAKAMLARGARPSKETFRLAGYGPKTMRELLAPYKS